MGGNHSRRGAPAPRPLRHLAVAVVVPLVVATVLGLVWLWPDSLPEREQAAGAVELRGTVTEIVREQCPEVDAAADTAPTYDVNGCGRAVVRLEATDGDGGEEVEAVLPNDAGAPELDEGDDVVLLRSDAGDDPVYSIVDHQRLGSLWILAAVFALTVAAFGRVRGVLALVGLALTFVVLLFFVVPAILDGQSPLPVAIVGAAAIALTVLYLTHGLSLLTTVAVVGTLASLALTGLLSGVTVAALHLTGVVDDQSAALVTSAGLDSSGLLIAGIVIGSLGVLDDVTVTQAATVEEVSRANPEYRTLELYRAGSRVGRSHIASVINTIVLAYAGSALPLMIIIVSQRDALGEVVTDQVIAQEIARSVVATLGLIAAVPITTVLAALVSRERRRLD